MASSRGRFVLALELMPGACGGSSGTTAPSSTGPAAAESADTRPLIQSMNPARPVEPGPSNRSLTLYGRWFRDGLTVLFTDPRGPRAVEGRVVQGNTIFLFTPLPVAGRYAIQVTNPDGRASNEFVFTVDP